MNEPRMNSLVRLLGHLQESMILEPVVVVVMWLVLIFGAMSEYALVESHAQSLQESAGKALKENKSLADQALRWRCESAVKFHCSTEGCKRVKPTVWTNIDFPGVRYERCDTKGCDEYPMTHSSAGIYTTLSPGLARGSFLKVLNNGREFMEVASLGTAAFVSFGQCTPQRK